jgi:DNA polymerase elongation subunit (family B)
MGVEWVPSNRSDTYDPLLFGRNQDEGLVAVEYVESRNSSDEVVLFFRRGDTVQQTRETFEPFLIAGSAVLSGCPVKYHSTPLKGVGWLNTCAFFRNWKDLVKVKTWLSKATGLSAGAPNAPYLCINDPVHQYFLMSGRTLFLGMKFEDLRRLQVDIECCTSEGYEFCNAEREGDAIIAIALSDQSGWVEVLSGKDMSEEEMLRRFVGLVRERDPDVIEGHNIFNFDLPYIAERAKRHGVKLTLGRDESEPARRPSQFSAAERSIAYQRFDIFGRHVVDTLFLVHAYDVSHRSLDGFGLKEVAVHFGVAAKDRVYIEGSQIGEEFKRNANRVIKYVQDDVVETRGLASILSMSSFVQAQMLPYSYQNVCVRGSATKIDALMLREYLRQGYALPSPDKAREFEGGYTDIFAEGVVKNVHHCDIRSLYPSLMLTRRLAPRNDELGVFLKLLDMLRTFRLSAKEKMKRSVSKSEATYYDALQATFKVLINSFYGYLGFSQARFSDFDTAEKVTSDGRALLGTMIVWLKDHGATPVEIDTDGIYFVPPLLKSRKQEEEFRASFAETLPSGIEVEFDGEYVSMYSYKMKNYALLTDGGEIIIKGAALKSRGLEPFQRSFLREMIRLKLEEKDKQIPALKTKYEKAIREREWSIGELAKTETLQDAPSTYTVKIARDKRARSAVYELALASGRDYRAGDQLSYYVTGEKKSVAVYEKAKLASQWDSQKRDENIAYYLAKLDALYDKFTAVVQQGELGLS